jgi:hypothetical protein
VLLDEPDAEGVLLEPLAALPPLLPLGVEDEDEPDAEGVLGVLLELEELLEGALDEPPDAESFFVASDEALEDDDGELGVLALPDTEPDAAEPDGELGVVVEPLDDEDAGAEDVEPGALDFEVARSLSPQPVSRPAPSASETANARVESLILWASVGWGKGKGARNGPVRLRS